MAADQVEIDGSDENEEREEEVDDPAGENEARGSTIEQEGTEQLE